MAYVKCTNCGIGFERAPHENWKVLCIDCWRKRQPKLPSKIGHADIIRGLRKHIDTLIVRCAPFDGEEPCAQGDEAYEWLGRVAEIFQHENAR
jgi:hypothetical protein